MSLNNPTAAAIVSAQYSDSTSQKPGDLLANAITFNTENIIEIGLIHDTVTDSENFEALLNKPFYFLLAPQFERTGSGGTEEIDFWAQLDTGSGFVNVANSGINVKLGNAATGIVPLNLIVVMSIGHKIRFMQKISDTGEGLGIVATAASAPVPAIPSVILSVICGQ